METAHIVAILTDLRKAAEVEAEASCLEIETSLGAALDDVCQALYLGPSQICDVLGQEAFRAFYCSPAPIAPAVDAHADLRACVKAAFAKSSNVVIFDGMQG